MTYHTASHHMNAEIEKCIHNCEECHDVCMQTMSYCLQMGGKHTEPSHIRLLADCIQICHTSADFMLRGSQLHPRVCGVCAEICDQCAADCERVDPDDTQMMACADVCRRCAESCHQMEHMVA